MSYRDTVYTYVRFIHALFQRQDTLDISEHLYAHTFIGVSI